VVAQLLRIHSQIKFFPMSNFLQAEGADPGYNDASKGADSIMIDHISLRVADFKRALSFYTAALEPLGYIPQYVDEAGKSAGFGPKDDVRLWIAESKEPAGGVHIALKSLNRAAVNAFHAAALKAGAKDNGKAGLRPDYHANYYAAFVIDPNGNNLEAVTHDPE